MPSRIDTSRLTWADIHHPLGKTAPLARYPTATMPDGDAAPPSPQLTARLEAGAWVVQPMRWGLVPAWRSGRPLHDTAKGRADGFKPATFNARLETCALTSIFEDAFAHRRCLVPAAAWYEWTQRDGGTHKNRFARKDGQAIWFAGLWDRAATPDAGDIVGVAIVTSRSAGWLTAYHDRAPIVLDEADWMTWLDPAADPAPLLDAARAERFVVDNHPPSTRAEVAGDGTVDDDRRVPLYDGWALDSHLQEAIDAARQGDWRRLPEGGAADPVHCLICWRAVSPATPADAVYADAGRHLCGGCHQNFLQGAAAPDQTALPHTGD